MVYVIAAYAIVIGSLVGYGLWIWARRRALIGGERSRQETVEDERPPG